jgi:hypothetical protein
MHQFNSPLDHVRIAAPCQADWDEMVGTDRVRYCGQCHLNVYNLSSMTKSDAESFIVRNEGRLCIRFYRRADGSILTEDCPVGLQAARQRVSRFVRASASAFLGFFAGLGLTYATQEFREPDFMGRRVMVQEADRFSVTGTYINSSVESPEPVETSFVGQLIRPEAKPIRRGRKVQSR